MLFPIRNTQGHGVGTWQSDHQRRIVIMDYLSRNVGAGFEGKPGTAGRSDFKRVVSSCPRAARNCDLGCGKQRKSRLNSQYYNDITKKSDSVCRGGDEQRGVSSRLCQVLGVA